MNDIQAVMTSFVGAVPYGRWASHNCPACIHNGQPRPDTRKRGGARIEGDGGFSFNCFNCGFHAGWKPGMKFSEKMQNLASWYGATNTQIMSMILIADEMNKSGLYQIDNKETTHVYSHITPRDMPAQAKPFSEWAAMQNPPAEFIKVVQAIHDRNPFMLSAIDYWWTPEKEHMLNTRYLIPFTMNEQIIGYTGRTILPNLKQRYFNQYPSHVLYNFDLLNDENTKDILVTEGPIDAALIGGVAICHYSFRENHLDWLTKCGKRIVIVPDRDKDGMAMVNQAILAGFSVAFPDWGTIEEDGHKRPIKDVEEAVRKYGRLYTHRLIGKSIYTDTVDIRVQATRWF